MQLNASTDKKIEGIFQHTHKHTHKHTHTHARIYLHSSIYSLTLTCVHPCIRIGHTDTQTHPHPRTKHMHKHVSGQGAIVFLCTCLGVLYFQDRTDPEMCRNALLTHKQARRAIHPATRAIQDSPTQPHTDTHTYTQTHLRAPGRQREEPAEPQRYLRGDRQTPCKKTNVTKPARIDGCT